CLMVEWNANNDCTWARHGLGKRDRAEQRLFAVRNVSRPAQMVYSAINNAVNVDAAMPKGGSAGTLAFRPSKPMTDEVPVKTSNHNRYLVKSLVHASRVLEAFQSAGDVLRLRDVVTRTGFNKGMCFRLLYTLHQCGFLDKVGENHYRLASEVRRRRLFRIGYAAQ